MENRQESPSLFVMLRVTKSNGWMAVGVTEDIDRAYDEHKRVKRLFGNIAQVMVVRDSDLTPGELKEAWQSVTDKQAYLE